MIPFAGSYQSEILSRPSLPAHKSEPRSKYPIQRKADFQPCIRQFGNNSLDRYWHLLHPWSDRLSFAERKGISPSPLCHWYSIATLFWKGLYFPIRSSTLQRKRHQSALAKIEGGGRICLKAVFIADWPVVKVQLVSRLKLDARNIPHSAGIGLILQFSQPQTFPAWRGWMIWVSCWSVIVIE